MESPVALAAANLEISIWQSGAQAARIARPDVSISSPSHRTTRQAGHKAFHRLGNAPAAPNPYRAANSAQNRRSASSMPERDYGDVRMSRTQGEKLPLIVRQIKKHTVKRPRIFCQVRTHF